MIPKQSAVPRGTSQPLLLSKFRGAFVHVAWLAIFRPCQAFEFLPTALLKPLGAEAHRTGAGEPHPREQSWRLPGEVWDSHLAPTGVCLETGERARPQGNRWSSRRGSPQHGPPEFSFPSPLTHLHVPYVAPISSLPRPRSPSVSVILSLWCVSAGQLILTQTPLRAPQCLHDKA